MRICVLIFILFSSLTTNGQITISGKIHNYDGKSEIYINHAREGIHPYFTESSTVIPSKNGKFRYSFKNPGIGILRLSYRDLHFTFIHEDSGEIDFEFEQKEIQYPKMTHENMMFVKDSIRQTLIKRIDGDNKEINLYLNKLPRTVTVSNQSVSGVGYSLYLAQEHDRVSFLNKLDSLRTKEFQLLSAVSNHQDEFNLPISHEIREYLEDEINSYYAGIFLNAMFLKRKQQVMALSINPDTTLTIYNSSWENLTEQFFKEFAGNTQRANSFRYNEVVRSIDATLRMYKEYHFPENEYSWDEIIFKEILSPKYGIDSIMTLTSETKYALQIHKLRNMVNSQVFYSPVLQQAIDSMQSRYPDSEQMKTLNNYFQQVDDYLTSQQTPYRDASIIEENYTSIDGLLKRFRGKIVLIDVWATWCHPCIGEFAYKNNLHDLINSGDLIVLYISIDKQKWEDRWRENLNYNRLTGYHILADEVLIQDMWETLGDPKGAIPRYALVSEDGVIVIPHAARPSAGDQLRNQILELLEP
jgi:thiol-disulfide isomerase/thioredoxin